MIKLGEFLRPKIEAIRIISGEKQINNDKDMVFEHIPVACYHADPEGNIIDCNRAFEDLTGYQKEELIGNNLWEMNIFCKHDVKRAADKMFDDKMDHYSGYEELRMNRKDGEQIIVQLVTNSIHITDKRSTLGTVSDVTANREAQQALRESGERLNRMFEFLDCGIFIHSKGRVIYVNGTGLRILGACSIDEIIDKNVIDLVSPACRHIVSMRIKQIEEKRVDMPVTEQKLLGVDGEYRPVEIMSTFFTYKGEPSVFSVVRDITDRKNAERTINRLSYYDFLTGLPNRTLFNKRFPLEIAHAYRKEQSLAVIFLDLDQFKNVNDVLGHTAGDELLRAVAERLKGIIHNADGLFRMGGDEFIILMSGLSNTEYAADIAQKVLQAFKLPFFVAGQELYITASMGLSIYPDDGNDAESIIKNADTAAYKAKDLGGNNYRFYKKSMDAAASEKMALLNSLRSAVKHGEFELHYQPRLDLANDSISGVEALIRWKHPQRGMIYPQQFIPLAEKTGLIVQIGEWALRTACYQARVWQRKGFPAVSVAVNLSALQFMQDNLISVIDDILTQTGFDPKQLEIEITESAVIRDIESAIYIISQLKEMGIRISLDDFGTGYSSLSHIKDLNIDILKIDRIFINGINSCRTNLAIVKTIVTMAHNLNIMVTAEGVEEKDQLSVLRRIKCDSIQGDLFSRPLPATEFEKMFVKASF